jgi:lipid A 3-O-deacylase
MIEAHIGRPALAVALLCGLGAGAAAAQTSSTPLQLGSAQVAGDEASYLDLGVGTFGTRVGIRRPTPARAGSGCATAGSSFYLGPALGLLANTRGGVFGYAGLYADLRLGNVVITPLGGVGGYHRGDDEHLGGTFEFRLSLAAAYEFADRSRLGLQYGHISDAETHDINPGDNELLVTCSFPLGF